MDFGSALALWHVGMMSFFGILLVVSARYDKRNEKRDRKEDLKKAA